MFIFLGREQVVLSLDLSLSCTPSFEPNARLWVVVFLIVSLSLTKTKQKKKKKRQPRLFESSEARNCVSWEREERTTSWSTWADWAIGLRQIWLRGERCKLNTNWGRVWGCERVQGVWEGVQMWVQLDRLCPTRSLAETNLKLNFAHFILKIFPCLSVRQYERGGNCKVFRACPHQVVEITNLIFRPVRVVPSSVFV